MGARTNKIEIEEQIALEYINGAETRFLMNKYGYKTLKSITDIVKKQGYKIRSVMKLTSDDEDIIIEKLKNGEKQSNIANEFNVSPGTIKNVKDRYKEDKENMQSFLTIEREKELVKKYLNGTSTKELMREYGFKTNKSITDKVKKYGCKVRSSREEKMLGKIYDTFSMKDINNNFKAYFLGLLLTDGYIVHNQIGLSMTDEDVIKFLSMNIGKPYHNIGSKGENYKDQFRIVLNNSRLVEELSRYSVVPRKSHIIKGFELNNSEHKYIPYIIRGIIDGDGWIGENNGLEFYICTASQEFALWLKNILENHLFMNDVNVKFGSSDIWYVRSHDIRNIEILKTFVYDYPFGMMRKYNILHGESSETTIGGLCN